MDEEMDFDANVPQIPSSKPQQQHYDGRKMLYVVVRVDIQGRTNPRMRSRYDILAISSSSRTAQVAKVPTSPAQREI